MYNLDRRSAIELIHGDSAKELKNIRENMTYFKNKIDLMKRELSKLYNSLYDCRKKEDAYINISEGDVNKIISEINNLENMKKIKSFKVEHGKLILCTDMIYINHKNNRYKIGEFKITIDPNNTSFIFENLTPDGPRKAYFSDLSHHPHIDSDGEACFGNVDCILAELLSEKEYCALSTVLISYLESVNTDDVAGKHINSWDIVDENDNVLVEGKYGKKECKECGCIINSDEVSHVCDWCDERICDDDSCHHTVQNSYGDSVSICDECYQDKCYSCDECGHESINHTRTCDACGKDICTECGQEVDNNLLCSSCYDELLTCSDCGSKKQSEDMTTCIKCGKDICDSCSWSYCGDRYCHECYKEVMEDKKDEKLQSSNWTVVNSPSNSYSTISTTASAIQYSSGFFDNRYSQPLDSTNQVFKALLDSTNEINRLKLENESQAILNSQGLTPPVHLEYIDEIPFDEPFKVDVDKEEAIEAKEEEDNFDF